LPKNTVGIQLYVWHQVLSKEGKTVEGELERVLGETAEAGFAAVEGSLSYIASPQKAQRFRRLLAVNRLVLPSVYHGGSYHVRELGEAALAEIVRLAPFALECGATMINVNPAPIGREKTDAELLVQAEYLNRVGDALRRMGIAFVTHNHAPEIRNHAREFRSNIARTDPKLVGLCLDTHWVFRGGEDPVALLEECVWLVRTLHIRNSRDGVWTEAFGDGDVDYTAIRDILAQHGFAGPIYVELAYEDKTRITRPLKENLAISREYFRSIFGY